MSGADERQDADDDENDNDDDEDDDNDDDVGDDDNYDHGHGLFMSVALTIFKSFFSLREYNFQSPRLRDERLPDHYWWRVMWGHLANTNHHYL